MPAFIDTLFIDRQLVDLIKQYHNGVGHRQATLTRLALVALSAKAGAQALLHTALAAINLPIIPLRGWTVISDHGTAAYQLAGRLVACIRSLYDPATYRGQRRQFRITRGEVFQLAASAVILGIFLAKRHVPTSPATVSPENLVTAASNTANAHLGIAAIVSLVAVGILVLSCNARRVTPRRPTR